MEHRTSCPATGCPVTADAKNPDDLAIHLLERHGWDYDRARLWLRDKIENQHADSGCPCPECRYWNEEAKKVNQ